MGRVEGRLVFGFSFFLNSIRVSSGRTAGGLAPRLLAVIELFTRLWLKRSRTEH